MHTRTSPTLFASCALATLLLSACHATKNHGSTTGGSTSSTAGTTTGDHVLGGPTSLAFATQPPATLVAGSTFGFAVRLVDENGNAYTNSEAQLNIAAVNADGGTTPTLVGNTNVTTTAGVANFSDIGITLAGNFNIVCSLVGSSGVGSVRSNAIAVTPGQATQLIFSVQPANQLPDTPFTPKVVLGFADPYNNIDPQTNADVTLTLGHDPNGSATLSGGGVQSTASGITTYASLTLDKIDVGYVLHAAAGNGFVADSNAFNVRGSSWLTLAPGISNIAWSGQAFDGSLVVTGPGQFISSTNDGNTFISGSAPDSEFRDYILAPDNAQVVYANAVFNGTAKAIERSANGATSWDGSLAATQRVLFASDANTLFASGVAGGPAAPLAISTDGARTWTTVLDKANVVADKYRASGQLYAADANDLYTSPDNGVTWSTPRALPASGGWLALKADQQSAGLIYIYGTQGLWRSADSGSTWSQLLFISVADVAVSSDPNTLYAVANNNTQSALAVLGTTDAGNSWSNAGWGLPLSNGGCTVHLTVDAANKLLVYLSISATGGCEVVDQSTSLPVNAGLYRTLNGGF